MKKTAFLLVMFLCLQVAGQEGYVPSEENLKARQWFEEARFGLFIHWGVYSILGDGEWVMNVQNIPVDAYEKLPSFFNPIAFDADQWVKIAKDAGMKYITITSRHHDGFSMFDSKASDYNIVKRTPYGKDILKALAESCRKQGIKLFFYYSLLDWRHDDYFPRGRTGTEIPGRAESGNWENYIQFMKDQLTELLTEYGEIGGIWLDGHWDQKEWDVEKFGPVRVDWHYDEIYPLIHELQPHCLIGNNHHIAPIPGEDFQMFEKDLPGKNTTGWGTSESDIGKLPLEVCETINGSWGFNLQDRKHKSHKTLVQYLVSAAGYGANLLLNVGPMPNGAIQKEHVRSLAEIGKWMRANGETIYGTKAGPIRIDENVVSTRKDNTVYLHLIDSETQRYVLPGFRPEMKSIRFFNSGEPVPHSQTDEGLVIEIPEDELNAVDTIVELKLK
jgi:alpha-L-fucosidase